MAVNHKVVGSSPTEGAKQKRKGFMTENEKIMLRFSRVFNPSKMLIGRRLTRKDAVTDIKESIDLFVALREKFEAAVKLISKETGSSESGVYFYMETVIGAAEAAGARAAIEVSDFVPIVVDFIKREQAANR